MTKKNVCGGCAIGEGRARDSAGCVLLFFVCLVCEKKVCLGCAYTQQLFVRSAHRDTVTCYIIDSSRLSNPNWMGTAADAAAASSIRSCFKKGSRPSCGK